MKKRLPITLFSIFLIGLFAVILGIAFGLVKNRLDAQERANSEKNALPAVETGLANQAKLTALQPAQTFADVTWSAAPPCVNQPVNAAEWSSLLAEAAGETAARQAALLAPEIAANQAGVKGLMAAPEAAEAGQQALAALALNVATGRLNRATEIHVSALPDVKTVGDLLAKMEADGGAEFIEASRQVESGQAITRPVCARVIVTNATNQPEQALWAEGAGIQAALPVAAGQQPGPVMDTGSASPNGKWAAFTSLGYDAGGPIYLNDLTTGAWTNLIQAMNERSGSGAALPEDAWWEVVGWFPDSRRILISSADASSVYLVDIETFDYQFTGFPGGGSGGARVISLAPDGTSFAFIGGEGEDTHSLSIYRFGTGETTALLTMPSAEGAIQYPRFAPDGQSIAYLVQKGQPLTGMTYAIGIYSLKTGQESILFEGNLGASVPVWSPDGRHIAFTRKTEDTPDIAVEGQAGSPLRRNVWVVEVASGKAWQVTSIDGEARSPAWSADSRTLAFVTHDGQVGMAQIDRPGEAWQASAATGQDPLFTSAFFVP